MLSQMEFLQNWASFLIAQINPAVLHNLEKYLALKKLFYLSTLERGGGDYLEFGVFQGSSFCHAIRCHRKLIKNDPNIPPRKFYGFDSFQGFGDLDEKDRHPFYKDQNFSTSLVKVKRRVAKVARKNIDAQIIPGFFKDTLKQNLGIEKIGILFIDSDTFESANQALNFSTSIMQIGSFIMLDDYFSYRGRNDRGVRRAFLDFLKKGFEAREVLKYGMGGVAFVVSKCPENLNEY